MRPQIQTAKTVTFAALVLAVLFGALMPRPVSAQVYDSSVRMRLGLLRPQGDSRYWDDKRVDFTGRPSDFQDLTGGVDFLLELSPFMGVLFSASGYEGQVTQRYLDWEDQDGGDIVHDTGLALFPLTVAWTLRLTPPHMRVRPYLGLGGGMYFWRLTETGDFIDFGVDPPEVFPAAFETDGVAFGFVGLLGLEVHLNPAVGFLVEGRWHKTDARLTGDFEGLGTIDLSAVEVTAGVAWHW